MQEKRPPLKFNLLSAPFINLINIIIVADRTEKDGRLCLWSWVHLVQELRGDGEAGARAAHREEEVVVGVCAQHGDGLVLVSAVMTILGIA